MLRIGVDKSGVADSLTQIEVFPNPSTNGVINLQPVNGRSVNIQLLNFKGELIIKDKIDKLSSYFLNKGFYILLSKNENKILNVTKIVIL